jgi:hypothetical protein
MNRLLPLLAVTAVTALATWGAREWLQRSGYRLGRAPPRPALETWEGEGGNLAPHETRPLQQQLG